MNRVKPAAACASWAHDLIASYPKRSIHHEHFQRRSRRDRNIIINRHQAKRCVNRMARLYAGQSTDATDRGRCMVGSCHRLGVPLRLGLDCCDGVVFARPGSAALRCNVRIGLLCQFVGEESRRPERASRPASLRWLRCSGPPSDDSASCYRIRCSANNDSKER